MVKYRFLLPTALLLFLAASPVLSATLKDQIPGAFRVVFDRPPTATEVTYWQGRVDRKEKTTYDALLGAMYYQKAKDTPSLVTPGATAGIPASADDKQSLTKIVLPLFIKIYGNDPTNAEKAWWRKRIACNEIKTYKALVSSMQFHYSKKVRQGSAAVCGAKAVGIAPTAAGIIGKAVAGISNHPMGDQIRVGIFKTDGSPILITADGSFQIREGQSKILKTISKGNTVEVSWSGGDYHVRGSGVTIDTDQKIRLVPLNQAIMQIKNYSDPSATYPGKNYNRFRGVIEIRKCDG